MTPITFEKRRHTNKVMGVSVAALGLLPGWMSASTWARFHDRMADDPSLGRFIAVTALIAGAFFAFGLWLAVKPQRVGLDLRLDAEGLHFKQALFLRRMRTGLIRWAEVDRMVFQDAPRVGESLRFFARDPSAEWHKLTLALKVTQGDFKGILPAMEVSAAANGLALVRTKHLPLGVYDRSEYRVERVGG